MNFNTQKMLGEVKKLWAPFEHFLRMHARNVYALAANIPHNRHNFHLKIVNKPSNLQMLVFLILHLNMAFQRWA